MATKLFILLLSEVSTNTSMFSQAIHMSDIVSRTIFNGSGC